LLKTIVAFCIFLLSACSTMATKEASYTCQTADVVSTAIALGKVGTMEANPIVAGLLNSVGWPGLLAIKLGVAWLLNRDAVSDDARAGVNTVTCAVALHNLVL
jgi:uncharacterized membrane protein